MTLIITEGRIKLLRAAKKSPTGLCCADIADLYPKASTHGKWSSQGAVRWGSGYAQPLVDAGLLLKIRDETRRASTRYYISGAGDRLLVKLGGGV